MPRVRPTTCALCGKDPMDEDDTAPFLRGFSTTIAIGVRGKPYCMPCVRLLVEAALDQLPDEALLAIQATRTGR